MVSALYLKSFRHKFVVYRAFQVSSFPGWVLKTFLCCDNRAKEPPGKGGFHRNKKFDEYSPLEDDYGMDTVSFEKKLLD